MVQLGESATVETAPNSRHDLSTLNPLLVNTLLAAFATSFVWFALTFWVYLGTRSVAANAIIGACFPFFTALFGILFGTHVDHHRKKQSMMLSGWLSLAAFVLAAIIYAGTDMERSLGNPFLWLFVLACMFGAMASNLRMIALSTLVTVLVPEGSRDKANGRVGLVNGLAFTVTSVFSGLAIAYIGMGYSIAIAIAFLVLAQVQLVTTQFDDSIAETSEGSPKRFDFAGALAVIRAIPGLTELILFSSLNNVLFGVFMALMDPYGLELVSVQTWGTLWALLMMCMMAGGFWISAKGIGGAPLKRLFQTNVVVWAACAILPLRPSIVLFFFCAVVFMALFPLIEAAEQTVLQKIVPVSKQGRVFGFAQTAENMVAPLTTVAMGPVAQYVFIPFMAKGAAGDRLIGSWFGTGINRGIGLFFLLVSLGGLAVSVLVFASPAYRKVKVVYEQSDANS
jgi:MFS transporter, DHA3 family, multidrug efflux protein